MTVKHHEHLTGNNIKQCSLAVLEDESKPEQEQQEETNKQPDKKKKKQKNTKIERKDCRGSAVVK